MQVALYSWNQATSRPSIGEVVHDLVNHTAIRMALVWTLREFCRIHRGIKRQATSLNLEIPEIICPNSLRQNIPLPKLMAIPTRESECIRSPLVLKASSGCRST